MTERARAALPWLLAAACLVYDPAALAADPKRALGLFLAALGLFVVLLRRVQIAAFHPAQRALFAYVAWLSLSALFGAPGRWIILGNWVLMAALTTAAASLGAELARFVASRTALLVTAATCVWIFAEWALARRGMQLHAGQGNPNWAGLLLAVAWPLALADELFERFGRFLSTAFGFSVAMALVLSESRVGWVAAGVALLTAAATSASRRERLTCASGVAALVLYVASYVALPRVRLSAPQPSPTVQSQLQQQHRAHRLELDRSASASLQGRLWIQRSALDAAIDHLPFGTGLGGFFPAFLEEQGKRLASLSVSDAARRFSNATTAHNDWLELAAEASPLAPLMLLGSFALALREWLKARNPGFTGALVGIFVAALADSPFHLPAVCTLLALSFAALPEREPTKPVNTGSRYFVAALILACAFLLSRSLAAWLSTRIASAAWLRQPNERVALFERAARLTPDSPERALELGLALRDNGDARGALRALERATELGGDVASYIALGAAFLEVSDFSRAQDAFEHALRWSPGSARAHSGLSEALRRLGQFDAAESHAALASGLLPGDADLRARLDSIREERVDRELEVDPTP